MRMEIRSQMFLKTMGKATDQIVKTLTITSQRKQLLMQSGTAPRLCHFKLITPFFRAAHSLGAVGNKL